MEIIQFEKYASFYDLLYKDKNYGIEADYIDAIIQKFIKHARPQTRVLDLACGTGKHIFELYQKGYQVAGSDISTQMIEIAQQNASKKEWEIPFYAYSFQEAHQIKPAYDVVISMFSAVNYLTSYQDQVKAFTNIYNLLDEGGVFVFDYWNGNAVVKDYSPVKVLRKKGQEEEILRISETNIDTLTQDVFVKFSCLLLENETKTLEFQETHHLHYYFPAEIRNLLMQCGFEVEHICPFLHLDQEIQASDWNISIIARKRS
ncbi:MAG: class I SAM-dependent DNA methyltransferase [Adhaeribacter sp.]